MHASGEVTAAEIARLAGVGRAAVSNWRKRFDDFPTPVGGTPTSPTFRLDEVERWLAANDRTPAEEPRGRLRRALLTSGDAAPERIPGLAEQLLKAIPTKTKDPVLLLARELGAAETFDLLLESYQESRTGGTPSELAALMVQLAQVRGRTVHDPACGTGALLVRALAGGALSVVGQEADEGSAAMARVRLKVHMEHGDVRVGGLRHDACRGERFDVVLCHPPFATREWGADDLAYDQRWAYGVPPRQESELAWVQHALAHTHPGGTALVVVPPAVASRPSGRRIRAALLRRGALHTVVALPPGMAAPAHLSLQLWMLRPPTHPADTVLLVDGSALDRTALVAAIQSPDEAQAHAARVPVVDLLDEEVDLSPARHLAGRSGEVAAADVLAEWERLTATIHDLRRGLPKLVAATDPALPLTTLADLVKAGALTIHTQADTIVTEKDVIVPAQGAELTVEVATGPGTLGTGRVLLRPHPDRLDSWFLAGFVARPSNVRLVSSLGSMMRLDIRRAHIPRLPLAQQRAYAELFRALHTLRRDLISTAENGRKAIDLVAEGLAFGTVSSQT